jgi:ubiquinone/menaquinone biosynthesis C-methylase UbiE
MDHLRAVSGSYLGVHFPGQVHAVGVGNPFRLRKPQAGERVLDVGCGCGLAAHVASLLVGPAGCVVGIDLTPEMVTLAATPLPSWGPRNLKFVEGSVEALEFESAAFDQVISNGVLNLVPDKDAAFREICRVLRPGGVFAAADVVVLETIPQEVLDAADSWSS